MNEGDEFDALFAHQEWVRRLALRLCADSNVADDLVQDTWIQVLRSRDSISSRAWLGGIVRHLARRRAQRESARAQREASRAGATDVPGPDELLAQAEMQRRVLAAVAELDERYRMLVLLRHHEGLSAEEIAERLRCPSSTVRNRLLRAHEQLRSKLDRDYGDRSTWSALFAPSLASSTAAKLATGVGITMKLQSAMAVAVLAALALYLSSSFDEPSASHVEASLLTPTADSSANEEPKESAGEAVTAESARNVVAPTSAMTFEHVLVRGRLEGEVLDGAPKGKLSFFDEHGVEHAAALASGGYSIFGLAPGVYRIYGWRYGCQPIEQDFVLTGEREKVEHNLTFTANRVLPVTILDRASRARLSTRFGDPLTSHLSVVATKSAPRDISGVLGRTAWNVGESGYYASSEQPWVEELASKCSGLLELLSEPPLYVSLVMRSAVIETRALVGDEHELVFEVDSEQLERRLGGVRFCCVDATRGSPIVGARVEVGFSDGGGESGRSNEDGAVALERLTPGVRSLSVFAEGFAAESRAVRIEPGETLQLGDVELRHVARLRGRVVDSDGRGVRAQLHWIALDRGVLAQSPARRLRYETNALGAFEIDGIGAVRGRLVALSDGYAIGALDLDARSGALEDIELHLERGVEVVARCRIGARSVSALLCDAEGTPLLDTSVHPSLPRVWTLRPGRYLLRYVSDVDFGSSQAFDVGSIPLALDLGGAR